MAKKNSGIKYIIYLIAFGIFAYYEYDLYLKYSQEKVVRDRIKEEKTEEIKKAFLLREKDFYKDKEYKKKYEMLKAREAEEKELLKEGGEQS